MTIKFLHLVCCLILISVSPSESQDHYWRHFNGTIPDDSLIGATNFGSNQYIGRGPVPAPGIFVGRIIPGVDSVSIAFAGNIWEISDYSEILCSDNESNFRWVWPNSTSFESTPGLIWGGYMIGSLSNLWIGRIKLSNEEYAIGCVDGSTISYINEKGDWALSGSNFEVLTTS